MKSIITLLLGVTLATTAGAVGIPVTYEISGKSFDGYFISPSADAPLVLLIHDWDGLTDYEIKRANMLADMGYAVFAADLFGSGIRPTEVKDKRQHTGELFKDREYLRTLLFGALKEAKLKGGNTTNTVAMGYCFGGAAVLELARAGANLKGFVTFHGGLNTPKEQDYSKTKGKLLILHGTADTNIPMKLFASLATELEDEDIAHEMITYSGAPHAFTVFGSDRYTEDADKKSWNRFSDFLKETLH